MDLFNELGNALNPLTNEPFNWPVSNPPYFSVLGWEQQKKDTERALNYEFRDNKAFSLIHRVVEMQNLAIAAIDESMFNKYGLIFTRLIRYRMNLLTRYSHE
jgi:hypothetical protein